MSPVTRRALLSATALGLAAPLAPAAAARAAARGRLVPTPARRSVRRLSLPNKDTIVFLVPHADDEVISMGMGIMTAVNSGRRVVVVLVTDSCGNGAGTRNIINARLTAEARAAGKTSILLTDTAFSAARRAEMAAALAAYGVPASAIVAESVPGRPSSAGRPYIGNGKCGSPLFREFVNSYVSQYPQAAFATMSWLDWHPDHAYLGYALDAAALARPGLEAVFFQSPLYQPGASGAPRVTLPATSATSRHAVPHAGMQTVPPVATPLGVYLSNPEWQAANSAAVDAYAVWAPAAGRYAVGWTSVANQLVYARRTASSWLHYDSRHWTSNAAQVAAAAWARTYQASSQFAYRPDVPGALA